MMAPDPTAAGPAEITVRLALADLRMMGAALDAMSLWAADFAGRLNAQMVMQQANAGAQPPAEEIIPAKRAERP